MSAPKVWRQQPKNASFFERWWSIVAPLVADFGYGAPLELMSQIDALSLI